jgi:3-oxoacyl-[acyl-carrier protein] reductase
MPTNNQVVFITNATCDIGKAVAYRFAQEKANLILGYAHNINKVQSIGKECEESGAHAIYVKVYIDNEINLSEAIQTAINHFGRIDSVINTTTISRSSYLMTMKKTSWIDVLETNLIGAVNCIKTALPPLIRQRKGNIVLTLNLDAISGVSGHVHQSTAEATVLDFMKEVAREVGQHHIRINAVIYGFILTQYTLRAPKRIYDLHLADIPLGYYGSPNDVAETAAFLASDRASYITGQSIIVDGGLHGASYLCWQMLSSESELD